MTFDCLYIKINSSLDFVYLFLLGHLPVQVTLSILTSDGSEIQASVEGFRPVN